MHHLTKSVVCPFFLNAVNYSVHCEGYKKGNSLRVCFDNKAAMDAHTKEYCNNLKAYENCPIYKLIMKKYEEDRDE